MIGGLSFHEASTDVAEKPHHVVAVSEPREFAQRFWVTVKSEFETTMQR